MQFSHVENSVKFLLKVSTVGSEPHSECMVWLYHRWWSPAAGSSHLSQYLFQFLLSRSVSFVSATGGGRCDHLFNNILCNKKYVL